MGELESQLSTEKTRRMSDAEEWKQFQADLLMTVRVANDFQTEAQQNLEQKSSETEELTERIRMLENENESRHFYSKFRNFSFWMKHAS